MSHNLFSHKWKECTSGDFLIFSQPSILKSSTSTQKTHRFDSCRFAVTTGTVQRKRPTLTYWRRVGARPVLLSPINAHLNLQRFLQGGIRRVPTRSACFSAFSPSGRREGFNLRLYFLLFKREVSFSGPMQVLLMVLVLWCHVKRDVTDAWQECWGGERMWCTALPLHHLLPSSQPSWAPPSSSLQIYGFCWMQAELFCILPISPQGQCYRSWICSVVCNWMNYTGKMKGDWAKSLLQRVDCLQVYTCYELVWIWSVKD